MSEISPAVRTTLKLWKLILGWALVLIGLVMTPLPIPVGLLMVAAGLSLLIVESRSVRRAFQYLRGHWPRFNAWLLNASKKLPESLRRVLRMTEPRE